MMKSFELSLYKKFIKYLANESAKVIMPYFRKPLEVENKSDQTPVTIADREAEKRLRQIIKTEFPAHGIIGEEFQSHRPKADFKWVLDPIDGTKSFVSGNVLFGTLIALLKNDQPILGAINLPALSQFVLGDNNICLLNGTPVRMRSVRSLSEATLLTSDHLMNANRHNCRQFSNLMNRAKLYRTWGDCYGYYLLASGYADIMIDAEMSIWDSMAIIPVIRGAGGVISDYNGNEIDLDKSIIAAAKEIHPQVIEILNSKETVFSY